MNYLTLPTTELTASRIALGCMRIADKSVDDVEKLVRCALDLGINFFDHADIYGGGKSEEIFGEVLKRHPDYKELNDVLQILADKYNVTKTAIAIAWLLRHPAKMQPIIGTTSPEHLREMAAAADINLSRQEWYDLYLASGKPLP